MTPVMSAQTRGYVMSAAAYGIMGCIGAVVTWAQAPAVMLVLLCMGIGALVLAAVFARAPILAESRRPYLGRLVLVVTGMRFDLGVFAAGPGAAG